MAKESTSKERSDHRGERERSRSDRNVPSSSSRSGREREGSTSSSSSGRERDRANRDEGVPSKRLRNEGEPKIGNSTTSSSKSDSSISTSKVSTSVSATTAVSSSAISTSSGSRTTGEESHASLNKKELYESVVEFENNESRRLATSDGLAQCQDICKSLEQNVNEIIEFKNSSKDDPDYLEEKMSEGLMMITSLRRLNRIMKLKLKCVKEDQLATRNGVDTDHLLLQNLLYEATHLQNQVAAVQDYKGMDEKIDLIPIPQFFEEAPSKISKSDVTKNDPHLLRIARLEYEFIQRQKLTEQCGSLEKEKEQIAKSIEEKQAQLDSIKPMLANVLEATKPVQEFFGINISAKKEQNEVARYLPPELYVLLVQSNAFKESQGNNNNFGVHICGSVEAAKELVITPDEVEEDSDSDKDQDPDVEVSERRRRLLRKKSSVYVTPEESKKKLIQKHPLWVEWIVKTKEGDAILIQFFYLIKLKIVTVKAKVLSNIISTKPSDTEIETSDNLLADLFNNDSGTESPNPANLFMFRRVDSNGIVDYINDTGRPFKWAQRLAGVEFPEAPSAQADADKQEENSQVHPKMQISAMNIDQTLKLVRKRMTNQTKLLNQLKALDSKNIQIPVAAKDLFPTKTSTLFNSWEQITWKEYKSNSFIRDHLRTESVSEKHMFYKAALERGRAKVVALVGLCLDFPTVPPIFCIQLEQDGEKRNATNDAAVRDLEKEVNVHAPREFEQWAEVLVSLQLQRLIQCIDIILETDFMLGESTGPSEFGREKLFLRAAAGRNLRRPFKYFGTGGGYFSQRF